MKRKLTALIHEFDDEWDEALPATLLAMRTSVNCTTGFTPFYLEHGREAITSRYGRWTTSWSISQPRQVYQKASESICQSFHCSR